MMILLKVFMNLYTYITIYTSLNLVKEFDNNIDQNQINQKPMCLKYVEMKCTEKLLFVYDTNLGLDRLYHLNLIWILNFTILLLIN